jgi:hypothetical protein
MVTYRIPSHTRVSLPIVGKGLSRSSVMPLSGAEGGELTATLASCRGVFGLSSHLPQSEVFTLRSLRKKRNKGRKYSLGDPMSLVGHP